MSAELRITINNSLLLNSFLATAFNVSFSYCIIIFSFWMLFCTFLGFRNCVNFWHVLHLEIYFSTFLKLTMGKVIVRSKLKSILVIKSMLDYNAVFMTHLLTLNSRKPELVTILSLFCIKRNGDIEIANCLRLP